MNTSAAPVTRPSARPAEEVVSRPSQERAGKSLADRGADADDRAAVASARRWPSSDNVASLNAHSRFPLRPSAEQLLPPNPAKASADTLGVPTTQNVSPAPAPQSSTAATGATSSNLTPQYRASHAQQQSLLERLLRQEGGLSAADTAALSRHKPLSSDIFHEAVLAYLESTGRHDVVMAMLTDERNAAMTSPVTLGAVPGADRPSPELPSVTTSLPGVSTKPAPKTTPAGIPLTHTRVGESPPVAEALGPAKAKPHAPSQRRSHELLKKGLLETFARWARDPRTTHHHSSSAPAPTSPTLAARLAGSAAPTSARTVATALAATPPIVPSLSQMLPTLYGMPPGLRGDITLLYCDIEDKVRLQYEAYALSPPASCVLTQVAAQLRQPMWSAMDTAESIHLPPVRNHVSGKVVMGTLNQLVEALTHVYVSTGGPAGAPSMTQAQEDAAFAESFFRQHRLITPSSVLLAKLLERFTVPIALDADFSHFEAHGITILLDKDGRTLPRERSQSETVVRLRGVAASNESPAGEDGQSRAEDATPARLHRYPSATSAFGRSVSGPGNQRAWHTPGRAPGTTSGASEANVDAARAQQCMMMAAGVATSTIASGPQAQLVTHYTRSATLWLLLCEKIRTKVLSVLLMWMQRHPNHFDVSMIHCVLHFVEECCYEPTQWSDCASTFPQIAELLRDEAYSVLETFQREHQDPVMGYPVHAGRHAAQPEGLEVIEALRGGGRGAALARVFPYILSAFATDDRLKYLRRAVPPSLSEAHPTMQTWLSAAVTLPKDRLPAFASRHDDILSFDTAFRAQTASSESQGPLPTPSPFGIPDPSGPGASRLHTAAQKALELFNRCTMDDYVAGLTAAHQLLFGLFPAQDLATLAEHTTAEYLSSRTVRQSHLGVFLRTAADLTAWSASLLHHAAFLDGEQVSASLANASIVSSLLNAGGDFELPLPTLFQHGVVSGQRTNSVAADSASAAGGDVGSSPLAHGLNGAAGGGRASPRSVPSVKAGNGAKPDVSSMAFVATLEKLLDLVVGFLRVNNVHASYAIFRGCCHPFVQRILRHPTMQTNMSTHTLRRIGKLEQFYGLNSCADGAAGGASTAGDDASASFAAHHFTQSMGASITSDVGIGSAHVLPDFLKAVSDSAEFPTIPAIPFHLRELRYAMTHEPTFLTTTCGDFPITKVTARGEHCEPLVTVVNWRKLRIIDDIIQRVNALQVEALYYVSSKSTVVHSLNEDPELERAFKEQLDDVIVLDATTLQVMANSLLAVLQ